MIVTSFSFATLKSLLVIFSGIPSAIIAIVRIFLHSAFLIVSMVTSYADRSEAKLTNTETLGCLAQASFTLLKTANLKK